MPRKKCPECGAKILREGSAHHQLLKKRRKGNRLTINILTGISSFKNHGVSTRYLKRAWQYKPAYYNFNR